jgi:cell division protein FtsI (penicillin-binding protein 3)
MTLMFGLLVYRLAEIQILRGDELARRARRYHAFERTLQAPRGRILDRNGNVLAESVPVKSLEVRPHRIDDRGEAARRLAPILGRSEQELLARISGDVRYVLLHDGIESNEVIGELEETIRDLDRRGVRGIDLHDRWRRYYPFGRELAHVLGFVGRDGKGLEGVEARFDDRLTGEPGLETVERDGRTRPFYSASLDRRDPVPGDDVQLTIDTIVQHFLERELERTVREYDAECAAGVVVSPRDGRLLALGSHPGFDPNQPFRDPETRERLSPDRWRNRCVTDAFPPGSTFKAFTLAAALEAGTVRIDETIDCEDGAWRYLGRVVHDVHPTGKVPVPDVLVRSSNIGAAKIGLTVGEAFLRPFVLRMGFGQRTGIRLSGEGFGHVTSARDWTEAYTSVSVSFGQEISATPIQLALAFSAIANGGWLFAPRLVERLVRPDGEEDRLVLPAPRRVLRPDVAEQVRDVLVRVVEEGSGQPARIPGYRVAGKTGTAERIVGRRKDGYISTFVAFAPARNPAVCVLITVYRPRKAHYARVVAAPFVGRVLADTLAHLGIPPDPDIAVDPLVGRAVTARQP